MTTIKIEFPADRPDIALAMSRALSEIALVDEAPAPAIPAPKFETPETANEESPSTLNSQSSELGEPAQTAETGNSEGTAATTAASSSQVDTKGVPFNPEFCGQSEQPFYASGKNSGQWKKRRGVDEAAYDEWYAGELAKITASTPEKSEDDHEPEPVNTAGAFVTQQQPVATPAPTDMGGFMSWVSEQQAAGKLTQDDVQNAYAQANLKITDLFPPNDQATIADGIALLFNILCAVAASRG